MNEKYRVIVRYEEETYIYDYTDFEEAKKDYYQQLENSGDYTRDILLCTLIQEVRKR